MKQIKLIVPTLMCIALFSCVAPKPAATPQPSIVTTAPQVPKKLSTWYQKYFSFYNLKKMKDSTTYFYNTVGFTQVSGNGSQTTYENGEIVNSKAGIKLQVKPLTAGKLIDVRLSGTTIVKMIISFEPNEPTLVSTFAVATDGIYYLESEENGKMVVHPDIWIKVSFTDMFNVREITASGWNGAYNQ